MTDARARKKTVIGTVISSKMMKTIAVREERMVKHPLYGKYIRRSSVYKAHDEKSQAQEGDQVEILFARPQSKTKNWRLLRIIRRAHGNVAPGEVGKGEVQEVVAPARQAPAAAGETPAAKPAGDEIGAAFDALAGDEGASS